MKIVEANNLESGFKIIAHEWPESEFVIKEMIGDKTVVSYDGHWHFSVYLKDGSRTGTCMVYELLEYKLKTNDTHTSDRTT